MASKNFTHFAAQLARAGVDFSSDTFKAVIVSAVPSAANLDAWENLDDVTTEIQDADYTAGGFDVSATVGAVDTANDRVPVTFSAANPTYEDVSISGVGCIIYKDTGDPETSPVLHFVDWEGTVTSTDGSFTVTFTGPLYIHANPA